MKRGANSVADHSEAASGRDLIVENEYDEYAQQDVGRNMYPMQTVRTFRQVEYSRLRQPITLPRWSRNNYRNADLPTVPQLAPEIRVLPMDEMMVYEDGQEEQQQHQIEADQDGQIDVCAIEEGESVEQEDVVDIDAPGPTKDSRSEDRTAVKLEASNADGLEGGEDDDHSRPTRSSERYRILRRTGNEALAARAKRTTAPPKRIKNDDFLLDEDLADLNGELIQEEIEVMDQQDAQQQSNHPFSVMYTPTPINLHRRATFNDPRSVVNMQELYDEMARYAPSMSIDAFNDIFGTESSMSYPLNVKALMTNVKTATPKQNSEMIASLAMQLNFMKREINRLREDIIDTRSATTMRQNYGLTGRNFDLNAPVSQQWYIHENPPLRAVDLVKTARDVSIRLGRKNMKTRDVITRYVRAVFDQMIPPEMIRKFTVRDRPSTRGAVTDIGVHAKDQIIGIVLDLMGLYDAEILPNSGRIDRLNFSDFVNQAMKTVMYDMRRLTPKCAKKARLQQEAAADQNLEHEE